jgi:hypothetical protein
MFALKFALIHGTADTTAKHVMSEGISRWESQIAAFLLSRMPIRVFFMRAWQNTWQNSLQFDESFLMLACIMVAAFQFNSIFRACRWSFEEAELSASLSKVGYSLLVRRPAGSLSP